MFIILSHVTDTGNGNGMSCVYFQITPILQREQKIDAWQTREIKIYRVLGRKDRFFLIFEIQDKSGFFRK